MEYQPQQPPTTEVRKAAHDIERRAIGEVMEIRAMDGGKKKIRGYALKWNQRYNMGWFTEEIHRDALKGADLTDVRALLNHDPNFVLGRTTAGTLTLREDETGLAYEIELPDTQAARDLAVSIERGDINQSSWGFTLRIDDETDGQVWKRENGRDVRTITSVRQVFDVSPVTFPANPDTTVAKRSYDALQAEQEALEAAKQKHEQTLQRRRAEIDILLP